MSTYYYMACDECQKRTKEIIAVVRISGQHIDNPESLLKFMLRHQQCNLRFISEYDNSRLDYPNAPQRSDDGR